MMNVLFKISVLSIFSIVIWFCIADNYLSAQNISAGKIDMENNQSQENNSHQNTFSFDDEENHIDKNIDSLFALCFTFSLSKKYILFNEQISSTFSVVIWQPPKIS
jgi:hypothetical protein